MHSLSECLTKKSPTAVIIDAAGFPVLPMMTARVITRTEEPETAAIETLIPALQPSIGQSLKGWPRQGSRD